MKLLANNYILVALSFVTACIGFIAGFVARDFQWFSRSGSLVVGLGITLVARTAFTKRDLLPDVTSAETQLNLNSPENFRSLGEPIPDYVKTDVAARKAVNVFGPISSFVGTVIWGFGDLLNHLFHFAGK